MSVGDVRNGHRYFAIYEYQILGYGELGQWVLEVIGEGCMRRITLSDHTADKTQQAQKQREDAYAARVAGYELERGRKQRSVEEARSRMRHAWSSRRFLAAIGHAIVVRWRASFGWPKPPQMQAPSHEEHIWSVGNQGEAKVSDFLASRLNDDWVLVSGYRNARGEIDQVLIGPGGLFTIEVKYINGAVAINGDKWTFDKYDKYGNRVEQNRPIADKKGRSPSRQLNEPTDRMLEFLRKSMPTLSAYRIVVLSHERADLALAFQPTVTPVLLRSWSLSETVFSGGAPLNATEREKVVDLLKRDHAYNERRRDQNAADKTGQVRSKSA